MYLIKIFIVIMTFCQVFVNSFLFDEQGKYSVQRTVKQNIPLFITRSYEEILNDGSITDREIRCIPAEIEIKNSRWLGYKIKMPRTTPKVLETGLLLEFSAPQDNFDVNNYKNISILAENLGFKDRHVLKVKKLIQTKDLVDIYFNIKRFYRKAINLKKKTLQFRLRFPGISINMESQKLGKNNTELSFTSIKPFLITLEVNNNNSSFLDYIGRNYEKLSNTSSITLKKRSVLQVDDHPVSRRSKDLCKPSDFHVSFDDLRWGFIIKPDEINARTCSGECNTNPLGIISNHARLQNLVSYKGKKETTACCVPVSFKPATFLIYDDFNNGSIKMETFSDVIVDKCRCY